jgi:hypothetical protein
MKRFAQMFVLTFAIAGFGLTSQAFAGDHHHRHNHGHNNSHHYHHGHQHHDHCVPGHYRGNPLPRNFQYFNSYWQGGRNFAEPFCAHQNYRPTQYFYYADTNRWCCPSTGQNLRCAPAKCGVITVVRVVGKLIYRYNAHWDNRHNCYRYHDCDGRCHDVRCR